MAAIVAGRNVDGDVDRRSSMTGRACGGSVGNMTGSEVCICAVTNSTDAAVAGLLSAADRKCASVGARSIYAAVIVAAAAVARRVKQELTVRGCCCC